MDRGAWWTAVHGVTHSRTWLKPLSMHACVGEGNGNPLQYSCLENPRDGGAWQAANHGVTQSWTWLKWLSSSSSSRITCGFNFILQPFILISYFFNVLFFIFILLLEYTSVILMFSKKRTNWGVRKKRHIDNFFHI